VSAYRSIFEKIVDSKGYPFDSDKTHVEWCRSFTSLLDEMKSYVMKFHTTGLAWNAKVSRPRHGKDWQ
jgi:hypothetical protein